MESVPISENHRTIPKHWLVLGLLVVFHAAFGAFVYSRILPQPNSAVFTTSLGFVLSHPICFAIWAAFAPQRLYHRFFWSFLLCSFIAFTDGTGAYYQTENDFGKLMLFELALYVLAVPILLVIRWLSGWRIVHESASKIPLNDYRPYQFGIKHIIILTTITAIALGLLRSSLVIAPGSFSNPLIVLVGCAGMYVSLLLPAFYIPWVVLPFRINLLRLFILFIILGVCGRINYLIVQHYFFPGLDVLKAILCFHFGSGLSVLITTLGMRFCGFRMVRERRGGAVNSAE